MRHESRRKIFNLPTVSIAIGPNLKRTENRGLAIGIVSLGGAAIGLLVAVGGVPIGYNTVGRTAIGV